MMQYKYGRAGPGPGSTAAGTAAEGSGLRQRPGAGDPHLGQGSGQILFEEEQEAVLRRLRDDLERGARFYGVLIGFVGVVLLVAQIGLHFFFTVGQVPPDVVVASAASLAVSSAASFLDARRQGRQGGAFERALAVRWPLACLPLGLCFWHALELRHSLIHACLGLLHLGLREAASSSNTAGHKDILSLHRMKYNLKAA